MDTEIDTTQGVDALNELLRTGAITEEQMNNMFSSIGYKPNVVMVGSGEFTAQKIKHTITGPLGIPYTYTDTVESEIMVPQILPEGQEATDIETIEKGGLGGGFTSVNTAENRANSLGSLADKDIKSGTEKNKKDLLDEERDIYHDINIELQKLENNLEKVQKARGKLVGGDVIDSLNKELKLLDKQIAAQKTKLEIAKLESQTLKETLSGQGVQFAEDGTITNYNAILEAREAEINGLINAYNSASSTDAQEQIQEQIDKKQEEYDKFEENLERYDEVTFNELAELENEISEAISKKIELNIEKFTKDITLKIDLNEFKKEWRELQKEVLFGEDDIMSNFNSSIEGLKDIVGANGDGLFKDQIDRMNLFMDEYNKIIAGGRSEIFEDSAADALEQAKEMANLAMESASSIQEYIQSIEEATESAIEQITSLHDSILDTFDRQLAIIEHEINVKKLLTGDSTDTLSELTEKLDIQINKINSNREKIEDLQYILNSRGENYKQDNISAWAEDMTQITESYEEMYSTIEETLSSINELMQQSIENSMSAFEDALTNNLGWKELSGRWEKDQELAEIYLSSVNKEYELQKIINRINEDLLKKEYDRLDVQKKINDFKNEELAILMKKDKLTQAEVDRANKLYELTLAQIALEEARNNKSSMKLSRDSQGNYVYQYGADEDLISKAQQDLLDKQNELYNSNVDNVINSIEGFNSAGQVMQDELSAIFEDERFQKYLGLSASETGRESEEFKELEQWLNNSFKTIAENSNFKLEAYQNSALQSLENIFTDLGFKNVDLNNLTAEQEELLRSEGIDLGKLKVLKDFDENFAENQITSLQDKVQSLTSEYGKNVQSVFKAAGMENELEYYDTLDLVKINTDLLRDDIEEEKEKTKQIYDELNRFMTDDMVKLKNWFEKFFNTKGQFETGVGNITKAMSDNAQAVSLKIGEEITAINNIKIAFDKFVDNNISNMTEIIKQIRDNVSNNSSSDDDDSDGYNGSYTDNDSRVAVGKAYKYKDSYWQVKDIDYGSGQVKLSNLVNPNDQATVNADQLGEYIGTVKAGGKGKSFKTYNTDDKRIVGTTRALLSTGRVVNEKGKLGTSTAWTTDIAKYFFNKNDRVEYGSGDGSQSWKVTGFDGTKVKLTNMYTGKSETIEYTQVTKNMNDPYISISSLTTKEKSYDSKGYSYDTYPWDKDGDGSDKDFRIYAKTKNGAYLMQRSDGKMDWATTQAEKEKFYTYKISDTTFSDPETSEGPSHSSRGKKYKLSSFNTGGYTGQWFNGSKDGRLAMLHQKELILNETDTPKILDAVKTVRELSAGSISKNIENQLANTIASLENSLLRTYSSIDSMAAAAMQSTNQLLEQAVQIDASFPGVRDSREIEEALKNLVNVASQHAYRKK